MYVVHKKSSISLKNPTISKARNKIVQEISVFLELLTQRPRLKFSHPHVYSA